MFLSHSLGSVPVLVVHVHQHRLLRLLGLDKVSLCVLELAVVLEGNGVLVVDVLDLVLHGSLGQLEGKLKLEALAGVVDALLQNSKLGQKLHSTLPSKCFGPEESNLVLNVSF